MVGPAHTVTNSWDTTRDALLTKENKVGTSVISAYGYTVNAIGQRESVARTGDVGDAFTVGWGYNARGEVTSANDSVNARDRFYQYDPIGNRIKSRTGTPNDSGGVLTNYTSNALNQYTAINAATPSHDVDGNQLTGPLPNDPARVLGATWDSENRMTEAKDNGTTVGSYGYDPFGRRIYKNGATTGARWFLYDGWNLVSEHHVSGGTATVLRTHLWGSDLSRSMQGAGGVGGLLSTHANEHGLSGRFYPAYDGNGNVTDYLDGSGNVHASFVYDPFGAVVGSSGVNSSFFFRFSTKYEDFETGLSYYGYRYYDPQQGRWLNRDPLSEIGGFNLYAAVYNEMLSGIDILGLARYEYDGQGFHVHDSSAGTYRAKFNDDGSVEFSPKKGHEKEFDPKKAKEDFGKKALCKEEFKKMRDAIKDHWDKVKDKGGVGQQGRNLRRAGNFMKNAGKAMPLLSIAMVAVSAGEAQGSAQEYLDAVENGNLPAAEAAAADLAQSVPNGMLGADLYNKLEEAAKKAIEEQRKGCLCEEGEH